MGSDFGGHRAARCGSRAGAFVHDAGSEIALVPPYWPARNPGPSVWKHGKAAGRMAVTSKEVFERKVRRWLRGPLHTNHPSDHFGTFTILHAPGALPRSHDPTERHLFTCPMRPTRDPPRQEKCAIIYELPNSLAFASNHVFLANAFFSPACH